MSYHSTSTAEERIKAKASTGTANDAELTGSVTHQKRKAHKHYRAKLNQALKYLDILNDPRLEETSAEFMARVHDCGVWMVRDVRKMAGIKGHQKPKNNRRPKTTKLLESWGRVSGS